MKFYGLTGRLKGDVFGRHHVNESIWHVFLLSAQNSEQDSCGRTIELMEAHPKIPTQIWDDWRYTGSGNFSFCWSSSLGLDFSHEINGTTLISEQTLRSGRLEAAHPIVSAQLQCRRLVHLQVWIFLDPKKMHTRNIQKTFLKKTRFCERSHYVNESLLSTILHASKLLPQQLQVSQTPVRTIVSTVFKESRNLPATCLVWEEIIRFQY